MTEQTQLNPLVPKRQYLVTYSQADENKFPTRESFGEALEKEFNSGASKAKVEYWACCKEPHENSTGFHYHCSIKLSAPKKWMNVKRNLAEKYGTQVHFSDGHNYYLSGYRYVCKSDLNVFHSAGHPHGLLSQGSPRTKKCTKVSIDRNKRRRSEKQDAPLSTTKATKRQRLSGCLASDIIMKEGVHNYIELLALAKKRRDAGQDDLAEFVFARGEKQLKELISKTWLMESAAHDIEMEQVSRIDHLKSFIETPCGEPCDGQWLECALEILCLNNIERHSFSSALRSLFENGRGKHRNILLIGPANAGKTFLLKPLQLIFKGRIFENPANDKFGWVGADKASVLLLNDFRWCKEQIQWKDLLLLLEGETVKLPAPKNHFSEDVVIKSDVPILATSKNRITYRGPYGTSDDREDEMMNVRWKVFQITHVFHENEQKHLPPCAKCFSALVFS